METRHRFLRSVGPLWGKADGNPQGELAGQVFSFESILLKRATRCHYPTAMCLPMLNKWIRCTHDAHMLPVLCETPTEQESMEKSIEAFTQSSSSTKRPRDPPLAPERTPV